MRSVSSLNLPRAKARGFQGQNQELSGTPAHGQLLHPRRYPWPIPLRGANRSGSGSDPSLEKRTFPITVWLQPRHRTALGSGSAPGRGLLGPANIKLVPNHARAKNAEYYRAGHGRRTHNHAAFGTVPSYESPRNGRFAGACSSRETRKTRRQPTALRRSISANIPGALFPTLFPNNPYLPPLAGQLFSIVCCPST